MHWSSAREPNAQPIIANIHFETPKHSSKEKNKQTHACSLSRTRNLYSAGNIMRNFVCTHKRFAQHLQQRCFYVNRPDRQNTTEWNETLPRFTRCHFALSEMLRWIVCSLCAISLFIGFSSSYFIWWRTFWIYASCGDFGRSCCLIACCLTHYHFAEQKQPCGSDWTKRIIQNAVNCDFFCDVRIWINISE